jgi:hypothetical protein
VIKINPTGTAILYSTFLGGSGVDGGLAIAVDGTGNALWPRSAMLLSLRPSLRWIHAVSVS